MSDNSEREAFELLRSLRGDYYCGCGHPKCSKEATQREIDEVLAAQPEPSSGVTALTSDLSARINRVSRRSLDGSVVMSSEEWNGIVELAEKLLTAAPQPSPDVTQLVEALEQGFPLLSGEGLDEVEHHCEWVIQRERKRVHSILAAYRKGGEA